MEIIGTIVFFCLLYLLIRDVTQLIYNATKINILTSFLIPFFLGVLFFYFTIELIEFISVVISMFN